MAKTTPAKGGSKMDGLSAAAREVLDREAAIVLEHPERGIAAVIAGCADQGVTIDAIAAVDAIERVAAQNEMGP